MRRYSLGSHVLVENIIDGFNEINNNKRMYSTSGLLIDGDYNFSAVVEYYELERCEKLDIQEIIEEIEGSIILALKLDIPMFIITYTKEQDVMEIYDYFNRNQYSKSIIKPEYDDCEFVKWWKKYKGTYQSKPFYKPEYIQWKINNVLNEGKTRWGGDIDGIVINDDNKDIQSIVEFRKATNGLVKNYDPAIYFNGTQNRAGDYYTWKPLTTLKDTINAPLYLVTLSEEDQGKYGFTEIDSISKCSLNYKNRLIPGSNICESIQELSQKL